MAMKVCDFARSFVTFRIDLAKKQPVTVSQKCPFTVNNARVPIESRCRITPPDGSKTLEFVLSASCKGEQVNVPKGMWHQPSPDMCMVASTQAFMVVKSWDRNNKGVKLYPPSLGDQPERQICRVADALDRLRIDRRMVAGTVLRTTGQIVEAVLTNRRLVGQTALRIADGSRALVEYPIKAINVSERDHYYQVDTGPILWPERGGNEADRILGGLQRAFIAHNASRYAEVIINVPTPLAEGISVNHYSKVMGASVTNRLIEVTEEKA
jgi:hypothetical protein